MVPTLKGLSRFKVIFFLSSFGFSMIFVLNCFVYPIVEDSRAGQMGWPGVTGQK